MDYPIEPSTDELAALIESLYTGRGSDVVQTQAYLQKIQRSSNALQYADELLSNESYPLNCKFFGALTFTVHLNLKSSDVNKLHLLQRLIHHTRVLIYDYRANRTQNLFIIKKLFQNLAIGYRNFEIDAPMWLTPLSVLMIILSSNQEPDLTNTVNIEQFLPNILQDIQSNNLILNFASILVEDFMKESSNEDKSIHERVQNNIFPPIKHILIQNLQSQNDDLKIDTIECLSTWFQYISYVQVTSVVRYNDLNDIWVQLLSVLQSSEDDLFTNAIELVTQIFETNPLTINYELRSNFDELISTDWTTNKINGFIVDEDYQSLENFTSLIIAFLEIDTLQLVSKLFTAPQQQRLQFLLNLTNFPLLPVIQENVSTKFIEFWSQILDVFNDDLESLQATTKGDQSLWHEIKSNCKNLFQELSKIYFAKIQLTVRSHDDYKLQIREFDTYRMDVGDLFDVLYTQLGPSLYQGLASTILTSRDINEIEASFFLLAVLSSNFSAETVSDELVNSVRGLFDAKFLTKVNGFLSDQSSSDAYARNSIKFLGEVDFFYKKTTSTYLNTVIDYLFTSLKNYPSLHLIISRTIMNLCDSCRTQLVSSIPSFEPILAELIMNISVDPYTREKLVHSVSCIIQSIADPMSQEPYIYNLIGVIEGTAEPYILKASQGQLNEEELVYLISLLGCIQEIAKGLELPDSFEEDNENLYNSFKLFWASNSVRIHTKLNRVIKRFALEIEPLSKNSDIAEKAMMIYKTGLLEDFGPFAFGYHDVLQFASTVSSKCDLQKTLPNLLELVTALLNCGLKASGSQQLSDDQITGIVKIFIENNLQLIEQDPDLSQSALSVFTAIVVGRPSYLIRMTDTLRFTVKMALELLASREKFVIKHVSKFWVAFLTPRKLTGQQDVTWRQLIENEIGALLTYHTFSGLFDTTRSNVEPYASIIVLLISRYQLQFKGWASQSLDRIDQERTLSGRKGIENRVIFLKKLLVTRGSLRKCQDLVKEIWKEVNGLDWLQSR